jgi:hypothetical protein
MVWGLKAGEYQKGDERILGDGAFVTEVLGHAEERLKADIESRPKVLN